ncbi:hypothetical protein KC19_9G034500 [Ceratodon purpureus]|uniref:Uncharacterized protein n=1 Tax=Ceratodon purpureus TaxID=3225 RepID=A0A8T0GQ69_CERPU|nr:hypothetical protein KC19_9G034500 [Ceratodon purpureus]
MSIVQLFPSPFIRFNLLVALLAVRYISHLLVTNPLIMLKFASTKFYLNGALFSMFVWFVEVSNILSCIWFVDTSYLYFPGIYNYLRKHMYDTFFGCILYLFVVAT